MRQRRPQRPEPPGGRLSGRTSSSESSSAELGDETVEIVVERLGARGDGVAAGPLYIPLTVPGDRIRARVTGKRGQGRVAEMTALLEPGPGRAAAPCRHFGTCGGCAFQHLAPDLYLATKRRLITDALAHQGITGPPLLPVHEGRRGSRRRVRFSLARRKGGGPALAGFARRASHELTDIMECPVLEPALMALLAPLRELAAVLLMPGEGAAATLLLADTGIDLLLDLPREPGLAGLEILAQFADAQDLARLVWRQAGKGPVWPVALRREVLVDLSGTRVAMPVEPFLQATLDGEAALTRAVAVAAGGAHRVADLYAGVGTFTFALAGNSFVHAVEFLPEAAASLRSGLKQRGTAAVRDLDKDPLDPAELAGFDAVVFDPPRAGAAAQAEALARSTVPLVVAVSCNPASFARDARLLLDGNFRLLSILPVDQFLWSPHVELVAVFHR